MHKVRIIAALGYVTVLGLALLGGAAHATVLARGSYAPPQAGTYIYDESGQLSTAEVANLESHAAALAKAGANPVVYLQTRTATHDQTDQDANALKQERNLGANSIVVFVNLKPQKPISGSLVTVVGSQYLNGPLSTSAVQSIYNATIFPQLKAGHLAQGLAAGLDAYRGRITAVGTSTGGTTTKAAPGDVVALFIGFLLLLGLIPWGIWLARWARRGAPATGGATDPTMPPDDLPPALVGALHRGRATEKEARAMIMDLASRGALTVEPTGPRYVQLQLRDDKLVRDSWQVPLWDSLTTAADKNQVVNSLALSQAAQGWDPVYDILDAELRERGLVAPLGQPPRRGATAQPTEARWRLLGFLGAAVLFVISCATLGNAKSLWLPVIALAIAGLMLGIAAHVRLNRSQRTGRRRAGPLPAQLTDAGVAAYLAWDAFAQALMRGRVQLTDLSLLMQYALVLDAEFAINDELTEAAAAGDTPAWLTQGIAQAQQRGVALAPDFTPYWIAFAKGVVDPTLLGIPAGQQPDPATMAKGLPPSQRPASQPLTGRQRPSRWSGIGPDPAYPYIYAPSPPLIIVNDSGWLLGSAFAPPVDWDDRRDDGNWSGGNDDSGGNNDSGGSWNAGNDAGGSWDSGGANDAGGSWDAGGSNDAGGSWDSGGGGGDFGGGGDSGGGGGDF